MKMKEIIVRSTLDNSDQPSLFYFAGEGRPLLVGLHTWSFDRFNQINNMLPFAEKYDFNLLLPEFRGKNLESNEHCTEACGSIYAKQDIKDAIDYVIEYRGVDPKNVFLLGASGGGHMALLMCGFCPEYFKAAAAFVPITDLKKWSEQNANYRNHVLACSSYSDEQMRLRSPITYIDTVAKANLKIFHGKFDPVVSATHSLEFYSAIYKKYPTARVFLDIFDGGHTIDMKAAADWIVSQYDGSETAEVTG